MFLSFSCPHENDILLFKIVLNFKKSTKNAKNIWWFQIKVLYLYYKK